MRSRTQFTNGASGMSRSGCLLTLSIKTIKTSIFDRRLQGIKALNDYIEKNSKNKTACLKLINLIKKNEIIQEIFGANYHSQIINKSTEIVK